MEIIYVISVIYLFTTFILYRKSENRINFVKFFTINIVLFFCYNMFICYIMSNINISINLISLTIVNALIASIFGIITIKDRKIQQYYIEKDDVKAVIIIFLIAIIFTYINLDKDINIKYIMTDASVHYTAAKDFANNDRLLDKVQDTTIAKQFMIGTYVNTGILFKIFTPFIGEMNLYKVFVFFDMFMFFIMGLILYTLVQKIIMTRWSFFITMVMITLFMAGYPLNSFIYGFVYLQLGVIIIACIINILQLYEENINKKILYLILLLCNFGIFFTYCIFVPVIYIVEFIYIIKKSYKETRKIISLKNIGIISFVFIIPAICGLFFFVIPHLLNNNSNEIFINIEGYIYRNCWSNFILLIPVAIFCIKKKNDDTFIWLIFTSILIILMILFFIAIKEFNLSTYYYYKFNYILWFILWYGVIYAANITKDNLKIAINAYVITYIIFALVFTFNTDVEITKELYDKDENITKAFDIYGINKTVVLYERVDYNRKELELLEYINDNIKLENNNMLLIVNPRQASWFYAFFNYRNREDLQTMLPSKDVLKWNNKEFEYILILYDSDFYDYYKKIIKSGKLIEENEAGVIYKNR